jgi:hypothetical protein
LKRIVFLIIASLLVIGLVLPGAVGAAATEIKVIVGGPMDYLQGQDMWNGAELAASEIGTFTVGGNDYTFHLYKKNLHEISDYAGAGTELLNALTTGDSAGAKYVIAGFRTEAVEYEIPAAISQNATYFITGAAAYSLLATCPYYPVSPTYAGMKYILRGTPFNDIFLLNNSFLMLAMVASNLKYVQGVTPRIAIFGESLDWAAPIIEGAEELITNMGAFGWEMGLVKTFKDTDTAGLVRPALQAIADDGDNIIFTVMSGGVGTVFSTQKGDMEVPAIAVGINVEAQAPDYWDSTLGNCAYEITMGTWAPGVAQTTKTAAFLAAYETAYDAFPTYTAASYDVLYSIKAAMVAKDSVDNAAIIPWFEDTTHPPLEITSGNASYYPRWDFGTWKYWELAAGTDYGHGDGVLPALNSTQYTAIYSSLGYDYGAGTNFTMPPFTTHDLIYGPGYLTGIAVQWIPEEE